jgi:hypothetical protein
VARLALRPFSALIVVAVGLLGASTTATASDATLRVAVNSWSKRIGADAQTVGRDARQRLPLRLAADATRFHQDALRARTVIATRKSDTPRGSRARHLALTAFADFARAGSDWAASARAHINHQPARSVADAAAGAHNAHIGNRLLVAAGKLLRP